MELREGGESADERRRSGNVALPLEVKRRLIVVAATSALSCDSGFGWTGGPRTAAGGTFSGRGTLYGGGGGR